MNAATGEEREVSTTTVEKFAVYTISYNGEAYFADNVFYLSAEQKALANDYAYNLSLFLGDSMFQGLPAGYKTITPLGNIRFSDGQTDVVYFNQTDERYANEPYGTDNIGGYGCGPTSMAMVVSSLTDKTVDPAEIAQWAYEHGYWCSGNGSYLSLIPGAAEAWGLPVEGCGKEDGQKIVDALRGGKLVVAIMTKGHFTSSGHFIVLRGVKDEQILVADPFSYDRSQMTWDLSIILNEAQYLCRCRRPILDYRLNYQFKGHENVCFNVYFRNLSRRYICLLYILYVCHKQNGKRGGTPLYRGI